MKFRQTLLESTQQIDTLTKKLGKCVEQARPYYEARIKAKQVSWIKMFVTKQVFGYN